MDQLTLQETGPEPSAPTFLESAELSSCPESADEPCNSVASVLIPSAPCLEEGAERSYAAPKASVITFHDVSTAPVIERADEDTNYEGKSVVSSFQHVI